MGIKLATVLIVGLGSFGLSAWGLFNKGRSLWCAFAGVVLALGSSLGALHAWGEPPRSVPWTLAYLIMVLIGIASLIRQIFPRKQTEPSERGN